MAAHDDILWKQAMLWCVGLFVLAQLSATQSISTPEKKLYIVYMGSNDNLPDAEITTLSHHDLLASVLGRYHSFLNPFFSR